MVAGERALYLIGRRLARAHPDYVLIVPPLPRMMYDALADDEQLVLGAYERTDWFRFVLDGWESVRGAERDG